MVIFAASFAIGLLIFWLYAGDYAPVMLVFATLSSIVCAVHYAFFREKIAPLSQVYLGLFGIALGVFYAWAYIQIFPPWQPVEFNRKQVHQLQCTVASLPAHYQHYSSFIAEINRFDGAKAHGNVLVYWTAGGKKVQVGQQWQLSVKIKPVIGLHNGVGIDRELLQFARHVVTVATVQPKKPQILLHDHDGFALQRLRAKLSRQLSLVLDKDPELGIIKALALGDKRDLDSNQYTIFLRTGTSHLLAISGFHVGLAAGLGWFLGLCLWYSGLFGHRVPCKTVQLLFSGFLALIYAALAGFAVPTLRAILMLLVVGLYHVAYKPLLPWSAWGLALLVICFVNPMSPLVPGFLLSFSAVACLILLGQWRHAEQAYIKTICRLLLG